MRPARPKLQVPRTRTEWVVEAVALAGMIAFAAAAAAGWRSGPGLSGEHLAVLAVVAGLYVALTVLSRFPHQYNYLVTITAENAPRQYQNTRATLGWAKAEIAWIFAYLEWQRGRGPPASLAVALLPVAAGVVAIVATMAIHMMRALRLR